jgi:hypothetical protein
MNDQCEHNDCQDKDSVHYFMCHMMQEEFNERYKNNPQFKKDIIFNTIQYNAKRII